MALSDLDWAGSALGAMLIYGSTKQSDESGDHLMFMYFGEPDLHGKGVATRVGRLV